MIVLHGLWEPIGFSGDQGRFLIWAEQDRPKRRVTALESGDSLKKHPFALAAQPLRAALAALLDGADPPHFATVPAVSMLLPTIDGQPCPSPDLIAAAESGGDGESRVLHPWLVTRIGVSAPDIVPLLLRLSSHRDGSTKLGADLAFWSLAARFALELLARQRFLPSIVEGTREDEAHIVWLPCLSDPTDLQRFAKLAAAMPPVCRAFQPKDAGDTISSRKLVFEFVSAALGGLLQQWLGERRQRTFYSSRKDLSERWVSSLQSGRTKLEGTPLELQGLRSALQEWTAPAALKPEGLEASWRTCFRLEAPEQPDAGPDGAWKLQFLLQAGDDHSLLVPARQVWQESGATLRYLNRRFDQPQERLLTDLGRAARLFPPIDEALRSAQPDSHPLTTEEAYSFLRDAVPLLDESGYGILVPPWWQQGNTRAKLGLKLRMKATAAASGGWLGSDALVAYDWQIALGDQSLTREEFDRLARMKVPLVQVRGQWVELNPQQVERVIQFWKQRAKHDGAPLAEALRVALGGPEPDDELPVVAVETEGLLAEVIGGLREDGRFEDLAVPEAFRGQLRPYQERGFSWLASLQQWGLGGCLADDMGLGKTVQLIALLLHDVQGQRDGGNVEPDAAEDINRQRQPSLLICPTSVVANWRHELARFAPALRVWIHHGAARLDGADFLEAAKRHDLVVTSYALALRDEEQLRATPWRSVILDEAQNIKNPSAKQTKSIRRLRAGHRIALTGTPLENRLSELWSILEFLNPGYLGSADHFRRRFAVPIERWQDKERSVELKRLVQPFVLRRLKSDPHIIQDLPDKVELKQYCLLTREQATLYEAVLKDMLRQVEEAEGIKRKGLVLATLARLKQVCNHPAHFLGDNSSLPGRSGKLARLEDLLDELLAGGDKALVFTQFVEFGQRLQVHLAERFGQEVPFLHGGVPAANRDKMVARFQSDGGPSLFLLSLKAGGVGLNLTGANHVFHFDRWWNPAVENQASDRAFRIGQRRNVAVHKFVCTGTLEERIDEMIEGKKALAESIIAAGEGWLTELSTNQLRDIFALRQEAVVDD